MSAVGIIVCYEPDLAILRGNLNTLTRDSCRVVVYDNSESASTSELVRATCDRSGATYLGGDGNVGVAAAQNRSVAAFAGEPGYMGVVFLDQDSLLPPGFVARLHESYEELQGLDPQAGILGALPVDENRRPLPIKPLGATGRYLRVESVISSGSIVKLADLLAIGGFREELFIDLVDNEFSWRMARHARRCYVDTTIPFQHRVGSGQFVSALGWSSPVSAPFRGYYQTRNLILLGREKLLGWSAVARGLAKRVGAILLAAILEGDSASRLRFMAKGIWDGCRGRGGRLV